MTQIMVNVYLSWSDHVQNLWRVLSVAIFILTLRRLGLRYYACRRTQTIEPVWEPP